VTSVAESDPAPLRLDLRVMRQEQVSRSAAQSLIAGGHVRVNDRPAKSGQRVRVDDDVVVIIPPSATAPAEIAGPAVPLVAPICAGVTGLPLASSAVAGQTTRSPGHCVKIEAPVCE